MTISPIFTGGADDPGGRDDVAGSVPGAQAAAEARYGALERDAFGAGSQIGDPLALPPVVSDWAQHTGGAAAREGG